MNKHLNMRLHLQNTSSTCSPLFLVNHNIVQLKFHDETENQQSIASQNPVGAKTSNVKKLLQYNPNAVLKTGTVPENMSTYFGIFNPLMSQIIFGRILFYT